jgi:hypothetical protein
MQQYDATLKQLFERQARGLLRLLTGGSEVREFLNVEIPQVNVPRLDLLARMADTGRLFNIEFQTTNEAWLLERIPQPRSFHHRVRTRLALACVFLRGARPSSRIKKDHRKLHL